ncbi:MAG: hypothetical protein MRERV_51c010 [Mycoplasmataceae bacterium RV_VA103A]|nr:MAG: hypothetical protein MRERV_51c010 [Mycoplasmataceae bacterium RV_VA103A]
MTELIIIRTHESEKIKKFLEQERINYEIYQEQEENWKSQEKKAFQEWQNLTDEELITEWEKLPHDGREDN